MLPAFDRPISAEETAGAAVEGQRFRQLELGEFKNDQKNALFGQNIC